MNALVSHFGSGDALFTGAALLTLATGLRRIPGMKRVPASLIGVVGAIVVAFSAAPLPLWLYALWALCLAVWLFLQRKSSRDARPARVASIALAICCVGAFLMEVPWHVTPRIPGGPHDTVYLIGDSVSAGIGDKETWPAFFRARTGVSMVDLSRAGETVGTALSAAERIPAGTAIVLMEIGGNDMLGRTSVAKYRDGLDKLLQTVHGSGHAVVMLELPLPPGMNGFGKVQRALSRRYGVALIPRRLFMRVLAGKDTTVDGIHLSARGHQAMAEMIQSILGPSLKPTRVRSDVSGT